MSFTHTFVTLNPNARVSKAAVAADIAATFPSAPPVTVGQSEETGVVRFDFGEVSVTAGVMPAPIPAGDLEACYPTSWLWPTAREELAGHSSHLLMMAQGGETPLDRIIPLTMTMAALFGTCPQASGAYWGNAGQLIRGSLFRDMAIDHLPDTLPVFLWVSCRAGANPDGTSSGYTVGLKQFDLMEFETGDAPVPPGELRSRLAHLAAYLIRSGPVIKNGNTVGGDDREKIKVAYAASRFGQDGRVMRLDHGPAPTPAKRAKKGWE